MRKLVFIILLFSATAKADIKVMGDGEKLIWSNNSQTFSINASSSMSASVSYIWPVRDAVSGGQALLSDASGVLSWGVPTTSAAHNILSSTHDATTNAVTRGSLIYGNSTPKWDELAIGASARIFQSDGTDPSWVAMSGDATIAAGGVLTIASGAVDNEYLRLDTTNDPLAAGLTITGSADEIQLLITANSSQTADVFVVEKSDGTNFFHIDPNGEVHIEHTADANDGFSLEIDTNAAGFGDIKAIDIDYITGAISAGEDEGIILINIDQIAATGGDIFALEILATEGSSDKVVGLKTGVGVDPVHHDSGTFVNPTTGTDNTAGPGDVAAMIDGNSVTTTAIFEADNEYILIGAAAAFQEIEFIITTGSSGAGIKPTFGYSISGSHQFTTFSPVDGTNGFRNTGVIAWDANDLTNHVANADTTTFDIRITRTRNSLSTTPILGYAKTASTTEFIWDKDGDVNVKSLTASDLTSGQVAFVSTNGLLVDDAGLTYASATDILTAGTYNATDEDNILQLDGTTLLQTGLVANNNLFFGCGAGENNLGTGNFYVGFNAGFGAGGGSSGINNLALGFEALKSVSNGHSNIAIGKGAGASIAAARWNIAIGLDSLASNVNDSYNIAIGKSALTTSAGAAFCTAIGAQAGFRVSTGDRNTFLAYSTGTWETTGSDNLYLGYFSGNTVHGEGNIGIGTEANGGTATPIANHDGSTCIGYRAGAELDDGADYNVFIGYLAGVNQTTNSDLLIIDNQDRGSIAAELTNSLIYGVFHATPASQSLRVNAGTFILGNPTHSDADGGGAVLFQGVREDGAGTPTVAGQIEISHDGVVANDQLGKIVHSVNTGAGLVEGMRLDSIGLGIGTSSPEAELHIKDSTGSVELLLQSLATSDTTIRLRNGSSSKWTFGNDASNDEFIISTGSILGTPKLTILQDGKAGFGTGANAPNAPLEVKGAKPAGNIGGYQSGMFHVTGSGTAQFSNSVITGHSAYDTNTQLWYLGSTSSSNNDIAFINRQNAPLHFYTNNTSRMTIDAAGNVTFTGTVQLAGIELGHASDTTITRASAGNLNIEGKLVYRADGTDVPIADGGTGQGTAQAAIDALSAVSGATNEHVLTKDTGTGNAVWKVTTATGGDEKVKIDAAATAGYLGAASSDGVLRTGAGITYTDGGDFVTLTVADGVVVQVVNTQTGAVATGTITIPHDDTIPQKTEGDEYMTLAVTPASASNELRIDVVVFYSHTQGSRRVTAALFQDATANALAAGIKNFAPSNTMDNIKFTHYMAAGTTSSTTFKVRVGSESSGTTTFNGEIGARLLGGVIASSITITEIKGS